MFDQDKIVVSSLNKKKVFGFEGCFKSTASQMEIFELTNLSKLLDSSLEGFSSTVFVYGQTGSGKTYT